MSWNPITTLKNSISAIVSSGSNDNAPSILDTPSSAQKRTLRSRFGRGLKSPNSSTIDMVPSLITAATTKLSDAIQGIMSNTAALSGDSITGFQRLIALLASEDDEEDNDNDQNEDNSLPKEAVRELLANLEHPKFVELCGYVNLASSLFQALRLLRMFEIKQAKTASTSINIKSVPQIQGPGESLQATINVCTLFERLCSSTATIEQMRPLLVKVLTFPLSALPSTGFHIQTQAARVIRAIRKTGFTSQQIWYLHDVQAVTHMVRSFSELVGSAATSSGMRDHNRDHNSDKDSVSSASSTATDRERDSSTMSQSLSLARSTNTGNNNASHAYHAYREHEELWVTATQCLVDIISCSIPVSTVLLNDFEAAGGFRLVIAVLRVCSPDRFLQVLNIITALTADNSVHGAGSSVGVKDGDSSHPHQQGGLASYLTEFLHGLIAWPNEVTTSDLSDIDQMLSLTAHIADHAADLIDCEHAIQGFSYAILKMYSNDTVHAANGLSLLEDNCALLCKLVATIPAVQGSDVVAAILTTVNFVFQCVESSPKSLVTSLNAAAALMVHRALDEGLGDTMRQLSFTHSELLFASIEAIARSNSKHVTNFLKNGLLKAVLGESYERLQISLKEGRSFDSISNLTYRRITVLLTDLNNLSPYAAEEIRKNGTNVLLRRIIASHLIAPDLARCFLRVSEDIAQVDTTHLQESLVALMLLIREVLLQSDYAKVTALFESLWKVLVKNEEWSRLHVTEGAVETACLLLSSMKAVFATGQEKEKLPVIFGCLEAVLRYLSLLLFHAFDEVHDPQYEDRIAILLLETGVMDSGSVYQAPFMAVLLQYLKVFSWEDHNVQYTSVRLLNRILAHAPLAVVDRIVDVIARSVVQLNTFQRVTLLESGLPSHMLQRMTSDCNAGGVNEASMLLLCNLFAALNTQHCSPLSMLSICKHLLPSARSSSQALKELSNMSTLFMLHDPMTTTPQSHAPYFSIAYDSAADGYGEDYDTGGVPDSSALAIFFSIATTPLPANAMSLSLWFRLNKTTRSTATVPLVSVESVELGEEMLFELCPETGDIIVRCVEEDPQQTGGEAAAAAAAATVFRAAMEVDYNQWNLLVISLRRGRKKLMEASSLIVAVSINGIPWIAPVNGGDMMSTAFLLSEQSGEIRVGFEHNNSNNTSRTAAAGGGSGSMSQRRSSYNQLSSPAGTAAASTTSANDRTSQRSYFHIASVCIFNEALTIKQASILFYRGVSYHGLQQIGCLLTQPSAHSASLLSTRGLMLANHLSRSPVLFLDKGGFRGLELFVDPLHNEGHRMSIDHIELPVIPSPIMIIDAVATIRERLSFNMLKPAISGLYTRPSTTRYSVLNLTDLENVIPIATLGSGASIIQSMSFGQSLQSIGGFSTWLALLFTQAAAQQAPGEGWLRDAILALKTLRGQDTHAMQTLLQVGYRCLSFAMYHHYASAMTVESTSLLASLAVEISSASSASSSASSSSAAAAAQSALIVDISALKAFAMNHMLWSETNLPRVLAILQQLDSLANDDRFSSINAMRLSVAGIVRWSLLLGTNLALQGHIAPCYACEMADYREEEHVMIRPALSMLQTVIASELRSKDLELITVLIFLSFHHHHAEQALHGHSLQPEIESSIHPYCTYATNNETGHQAAAAAGHDMMLQSMDVWRVYLIRLLTVVYEDNLEEIRRQTSSSSAGGGGSSAAAGGGSGSSNTGGVSTAGRRSMSVSSGAPPAGIATNSHHSTGNAPNNSNSNNNAQNELAHVNTFREKINAEWFITILQLAQDVATITATLRLLGLMLQKDAVFSRSFVIESHGMQALATVYRNRSTVEIPTILPLIGMLFRIPIQLIMHPFQVKAAGKVALLLELDECIGPILNDEFLASQSLPLLYIYYSCLSTAAKQTTDKKAEELLLTALLHAFDCCLPFKQLMQHKLAVEIHIMAVLSCTNALVEYGSQIFDNSTSSQQTGGGVDLTASLLENYIRLSGTGVDHFTDDTQDSDQEDEEGDEEEIRFHDHDSHNTSGRQQQQQPQDDGEVSTITNEQSIIFTEALGEQLLSLGVPMLSFALREHDNHRLLQYFFTAYSPLFSAHCERSYQLLVINLLRQVITEQDTRSSGHLPFLQALAKSLSALSTLLRGYILYDSVVFELLKITLQLLVKAKAQGGGLPQHQAQVDAVIKEYGQFARLLCHVLIGHHSPLQQAATRRGGMISKQEVLSFIRNDMELLFMSLLEDSLDVFVAGQSRFLSAARDNNDSNSVSSSKQQAQQLLESTPRKPTAAFSSSSSSSSSSAAAAAAANHSNQHNKNRISQLFWATLLDFCFVHILHEDRALRTEAALIISYLLLQRRKLLEGLLADGSTFARQWRTSEETAMISTSPALSQVNDAFTQGFSRLIIPSSQAIPAEFSQQDALEVRLGSFYLWVSEHSEKCDRIFHAIEHTLLSSLPSITTDCGDINRSLQRLKRAKDMFTNESAESEREAQRRADTARRLSDKAMKVLRFWRYEQTKDMTIGAMYYRRVMAWAQSSLLNHRHSPTNSSTAVIWRLDYTEGPERCRRITIRDFTAASRKILEVQGRAESNRLPQTATITTISATSAASASALSSSSTATAAAASQQGTVTAAGKQQDQQRGEGGSGEDVDVILRNLTLQGILRRQPSRTPNAGNEEGGFEDEVDEAAAMAIDEDTTPITADDDTNDDVDDYKPSQQQSSLLTADSLTLPVTSRLLTREDSLSRGDYQESSTEPAQAKILQQSSAQQQDTLRLTRSAILKDIIRGLISNHRSNSSVDLKAAVAYNIDRIFGLESQRGLLLKLKEQWIFIMGISYSVSSLSSSVSSGNNSPKDRTQSSKKAKKKNGVAAMLFNDLILEYTGPVSTPQQTETAESISSSNSSSSSISISSSSWLTSIWSEFLEAEPAPYVTFHIHELYSFFRRRHQLQYIALELTDKHGQGILFATGSTQEADELLASLLEADLPQSIFAKFVGLKNLQLLLRGGSSSSVIAAYNRLLSLFISAVTQLWQHNEITNFEYLMNINAAAGRSFHDLTQYPVFPWVLSDYASEELDMEDEGVYRDLSKPMGAMSSKRAIQYLERYQTMSELYNEELHQLEEEQAEQEQGGADSQQAVTAMPPFHFGTHYSCAGYVLHYLLRLQPFTSMSLALQGGHYDKADRLFSNIESSWLSASQDNLQDVRELIPEFYYLPDFLVNKNNLSLGATQKDEVVDNVTLPSWAHGDAKEFIRLQRMALESKHVSHSLHHWMDLIFGIKQRGKLAVDAMNVFIHVTYEGEVTLEALEADPLLRAATIAQINNFGQTPGRVFNKEHARKYIPEVVKKLQELVLVEPTALAWHAHLSPPLTIPGAPQFIFLKCLSFAQVLGAGNTASNTAAGGSGSGSGSGSVGGKGLAIGDIRLLPRDKIIAAPTGSLFLPPQFKRLLRYRALYDGITIQNLHSTVAGRALEQEKDFTIHEQLHSQRITVTVVCKHGELVVTGSEDMSVKLWRLERHGHDRYLTAWNTFIGHTAAITCLDICTDLHIIASGCQDGSVGVWNYRSNTLIHMLTGHIGETGVLSVSINPLAATIATLTKHQLRLYHVCGDLLSYANFNEESSSNSVGMRLPYGLVVLAPPSGDWQDGVAVVTGHRDGHIYLWKLRSKAAIVEGSSRSGSAAEAERVFDPAWRPLTNKPYRPLYVCATPTKQHRADITSLRLAPAVPKTRVEGIHKAYEESRGLDLLVGDSDGLVSRWTPLKLDSLSQADLQSILTARSQSTDSSAAGGGGMMTTVQLQQQQSFR